MRLKMSVKLDLTDSEVLFMLLMNFANVVLSGLKIKEMNIRNCSNSSMNTVTVESMSRELILGIL